MNELRMSGCRSEPLGSYLKALGVLRLVGEQGDPKARGRWDVDTFLLGSVFDQEQLICFFLDEYRPTPLVAPWNGGSGFKLSDPQEGISAVESSTTARLDPYRQAIRVGRWIHERAAGGWTKEEVVTAARSNLPEPAVAWIDAATVLAQGGLRYPPILGTGGNLGRLELSNNFMQHLARVMSLASSDAHSSRARSSDWLRACLFGAPAPRLRAPVGQFDPGSAGGANSSPLGAAESLVNPWDFVLLMEGSLVFASAPSRRFGAEGPGRAAIPFTFEAAPVGYSSAASAERSKGELWTPIWDRPASGEEVARLIGEGRSQWRGRQTTRALDAAKAAASLGVDRGVRSFVRHAIVERFGQMTLAVPVGRILVRANPNVAILATLDPWVEMVRRGKNPPSSVATDLRKVDAATFELTQHGGPRRLQGVLIAAAEAESAIGLATAFRAQTHVPPVWGLPAAEWIPLLDDGSPEFRLATALASMRDRDGACLRRLLRPVVPGGRAGRVDWSDGPSHVEGFGVRSVEAVLGAAHARRVIELAGGAPEQRGEADHDIAAGAHGVQTAFRYRIAAPGDDVVALLLGELDHARLSRLLAALMLLDWYLTPEVAGWFEPAGRNTSYPIPAWSLLAPFFHGRSLDASNGTKVRLRPAETWPSKLASGSVAPVLEAAVRRLRQARLDPAVSDHDGIARAAPDGIRLAAALLVPITTRTAARLLHQVAPAETIDR